MFLKSQIVIKDYTAMVVYAPGKIFFQNYKGVGVNASRNIVTIGHFFLVLLYASKKNENECNV